MFCGFNRSFISPIGHRLLDVGLDFREGRSWAAHHLVVCTRPPVCPVGGRSVRGNWSAAPPHRRRGRAAFKFQFFIQWIATQATKRTPPTVRAFTLLRTLL
ncbi:hypothetical protein EVAR_28988_1 [Eumeta japonica]|uniref:Uncharacterized protein n=1 Tax=Eumeta variegata TaxID=151549 RepID=A0A4C1W300_EUMVA|nr:hypothetical protein EVAR_28988_1 [Eumeta japonica]